MSVSCTYKRGSEDFKNVVMSFSWLAFIFGPIWAAFNELWYIYIFSIVFYAVFIDLSLTGTQGALVIGLFLISCLALVFGLKVSSWKRWRLEDHGYKLDKIVDDQGNKVDSFFGNGELVDGTEERGKDFLDRLADGDFGLAKTFWLFWILAQVVVFGAVGLLSEVGSIETKTIITFSKTIITFYFVYFVYLLPVFIGVWRAANYYQGNKVWSILAKIWIILSIAFAISSMII